MNSNKHDFSPLQDKNEINDPAIDTLTEGWLHKVIMAFHQPTHWLTWQVVGFGVVLSAVMGLLWWRILNNSPRLGTGVFLMQMGFFVLDAAVLLYLPWQKISFGPWKAQIVVLTVPRVLTTFILAFIALQFGFRPSFILNFGVQLLATAALIYGAVIEPHNLQLSEFVIFSDRLPLQTDPIKILQITDLHIERWTRRESKVLQIVKNVKPDVIIVTGDYVNTSYNEDPETHALVRRLLSQLKAPYGVFATLGSPPVDLRDQVLPIFDGLNIKLLRHDIELLEFENGGRLAVLGMDCTHHLPTDEARLARLVSRAPHDVPQLFVFHSPEMMPQATAHGIDLYMCGHTHGGQVRVPIIGPLLTSSQLGRQYVMGMYKEWRTHLYVSRGIGLEGMSAPRVRFLCPPEMTLMVIMPSGQT
ncbi:MAG: metallophosphoesterase [Chloroflexota bacterium]